MAAGKFIAFIVLLLIEFLPRILEFIHNLIFGLIAKIEKTITKIGTKKKKKTVNHNDLCTKLVVYTAYYCGSDSLNEETLSELKKFISNNLSGEEQEKTKKLEEITKEINEYFKIASEKVIDQSDIMRLCDEIVGLGTILRKCFILGSIPNKRV